MFQKVKGFQDTYGDDCACWEKAESIMRDTFALFLVREIRLPILEKTAVFNRGIGQTTDIVEKEMFTFADRDRADSEGELLSLRPEGTAGTVRAYIENGLYNPPGIKKLYYSGPMFRREKPQKGRYRQFSQCGAEFIGSSSPLADADAINLLITYFDRVNISRFTHLEINSVGCPLCRPEYHSKLTGYFNKHKDGLCADCNRRLTKNPLRILDCKNENCGKIIKNASVMLDSLCPECAEHFESVKMYLDALNVKYIINPFMVRGLDYYVRTAFEVVTAELGAASAVGGGGRYDGLVETLGGPAVPGVGFAIGMDRVVALMKLSEEFKQTPPKAFIVTFGGKVKNSEIALLNRLRAQNIPVEIDYDGKGMKSQLKQADRTGAKYAVIAGEEEMNRGAVMLRNLSSSTQEEVSIADLILKIGNNHPFNFL
ncbi:MAG: histidine--tRNA ligase [Deferribacteraceae bacterium]|jgi:histidyl-tRNA synthetase|nr:histidine--tRNA ligase [Deferribacteraceae bacterium]